MLKCCLLLTFVIAAYADVRPPINLNPATATWFDAIAGFFLACAAFFTGRRFWNKR